MKTVDQLDINYYVELAKKEIGNTYDLGYQTFEKFDEKAGEYTIVSFEAVDPEFTYKWIQHKEDKTPDGAELGFYRVRLNGTKFYNGKEIKVRVSAYVQDRKRGLNDMLFISNKNEDTGKFLKAYRFPILNWRD